MAHVRRGRMGLGTHNAMNTAAVGKGVTAAKNGSVVDLKRNVLGGGIAKRIVTRATLKTVDPKPKTTGLTGKMKKLNRKSESRSQDHDVEPMIVDHVPDFKAIQATLPSGVSDVDINDARDPQLCSENVREIYVYLRHLERSQAIREDFLKGGHVNGKMRAVLINWLAEVHEQFKLLQETLYLTVAILDRYLSAEGLKVKRQKLQLIGVSAMFLASKYEEMYNPEIDDFVYISDNSCSGNAIREMEIEILKALDFNLGRPLSLNFLRRSSKAGDVSADHHNLAKFALEASFAEYTLSHVDPSRLAAASLLLALRVIDDAPSFESVWTPNLSFYSGYDVTSLRETSQKMAEVLLGLENSKFKSIYNKYKSKDKLCISKQVGLKYRGILKSIVDE